MHQHWPHSLIDGQILAEEWKIWCVLPNLWWFGFSFPLRDLSSIKYPAPVENIATMVTRRFLFDGKTISKLKAKISANISVLLMNTNLHVTRTSRGCHGTYLEGTHCSGSSQTWVFEGYSNRPYYELEGNNTYKNSHQLFWELLDAIFAQPTFLQTGVKWSCMTWWGCSGRVIKKTTATFFAKADADDISSKVTNSFREVLEELSYKDVILCTSCCRFSEDKPSKLQRGVQQLFMTLQW